MRLIDADVVLNYISDLKKSPWFHENYFDHKSIRKEAIEIVEQLCIDEAPTIDAVPVVRCRDCKHRDPEDKKCDCGHGIQWQIPRNDDWFCADGERKDDE